MAGEDDKTGGKGLGGLLGGFTDLLDKLARLAESGEELSRSGSFDLGSRGEGLPEGEASAPDVQPHPPSGTRQAQARKPVRGVYGFSVKLGLGGGGSGFKVEPFGNPIRTDEQTGESVLDEVREPLVDVFDEDTRLLVVAEMPGVEAGDVHVELDDSRLTLAAERGDKKYRKRLEVPAGLSKDRMDVSCRNGIIEISCAKVSA